MENLFGDTLLKDVKKSSGTKAALKGKDLILLYFSASWCSPCKAFTPVLTKFYKACCVPNGVEILYISSDNDLDSFNEYYAKMPWLSLPAAGTADIRQKLAHSLMVSGIPHLVVLDAKTGQFIAENAKSDVSDVGNDVKKGKALITSWKEKERFNLEDAPLAAKNVGMIRKTLSLIFRNPMYLLASVYIFKKLMRKLGLIGQIGSDEQEEEL